jgi:hypothetical protein
MTYLQTKQLQKDLPPSVQETSPSTKTANSSIASLHMLFWTR